MNKEIKPLYRKVNTTCHGGKIYHGNNQKYDRNKKEDLKSKEKMKSGKQNHGLDFSPLYAYLRKNVGKNWNELYSEIKNRLPSYSKYDPLESAVLSYAQYCSLNEDDIKNGYFRDGESSTFSLMYVDESGLLQYVNSNLTVEDFKATCQCCTHTFNGNKIINLMK